jgi:metal-responsive CopG/Arc/MetJ family transcriptional regulator
MLSKHLTLLNDLTAMAQSPNYANRRNVIVSAIRVIVEQELQLVEAETLRINTLCDKIESFTKETTDGRTTEKIASLDHCRD